MKAFCLLMMLSIVTTSWANDLSEAREKIKNYEFDDAKLLLEHHSASAEMANELGWLYFDCLRPKKAIEAFQIAIKKAKTTGNELELGKAYLGRARVRAHLGEREEAQRDFEEGKKVIPYPRGPKEAALIGFVEAVRLFESERQMMGLAKAVQVAAIAKAGGADLIEARSYLIMGQKGSFGQRLTSLLRALDLSTKLGGAIEARTRLALASHERSQKKADKSLERIIQSTERLKKGIADPLIQQLRYEEGLARKEMDRWAGAIRSFVLARNAAERLEDPFGFAEITIPLVVCCKSRNIIERGGKFGEEGLAAIADQQGDRAIRLRKRLKEALAGLQKTE